MYTVEFLESLGYQKIELKLNMKPPRKKKIVHKLRKKRDRGKLTAFYDKIFEEWEYQVKWSDSPQKPLFEELINFVPKNCSIVEFGCGTGQLAELLHELGIVSYRGYDWSKFGIEISRKRCPYFNFEVKNLCHYIPEIQEGDVIIAVEFLEHIECDIGLLDQLPAGIEMIISLPPRMCSSHLRCFPNPKSIRERYENLLDFDSAIIPICIKGTVQWWCFKAYTK